MEFGHHYWNNTTVSGNEKEEKKKKKKEKEVLYLFNYVTHALMRNSCEFIQTRVKAVVRKPLNSVPKNLNATLP